jgi:hypothetical protein
VPVVLVRYPAIRASITTPDESIAHHDGFVDGSSACSVGGLPAWQLGMLSITHSSLADIARTTPSSTRVFLRHHLDFCCGGRRTLADACQRAGLDAVAIAAELEEEARRDTSELHWETRSQSELADYIEARFHASLRRDMPPLI